MEGVLAEMERKGNALELYKKFLQQWKNKNAAKYMTYLIVEAISWLAILLVIVLGAILKANAETLAVLSFFFILFCVTQGLAWYIKFERKKEWKEFLATHGERERTEK